MSPYANYYIRQAQTGAGMTYFAGLPSQRGHGLGSFLSGMWRSIVLPLLSKSAVAVGREALGAGSHILEDVASGRNFGSSAKQHFANAGQNLATKLSEKMKGNGIKRVKAGRVSQSGRNTRGRQSRATLKKQLLATNIFNRY